jgi:hypothetical protein
MFASFIANSVWQWGVKLEYGRSAGILLSENHAVWWRRPTNNK